MQPAFTPARRRGHTAASIAWRCAALASWVAAGAASPAPPPAVNVILCVADGTGLEQIKAGGWFKGTNLCFETWPNTARVTTGSADAVITDSAAAGTALATGHKVANGVISLMIPGDSHELETFLEVARRLGKRTGLVTPTRITDATPAAFGAHEPTRYNYDQIADDYLARSRPNVLLGGGATGMSIENAQAAGYTVVTDGAGLLTLDTSGETFVSGQFGEGDMPYEQDGLGALPHLSEMTGVALDILARGTNGFFLLVEGGLIDHACHMNDIGRCVREVAEFDNAVQTVLNWCSNRTDTLVVVTADHETGGLTALTNNGPGNNPAASWTTTGHSAANVGLWARGPGAAAVTGLIDNTDVFLTMSSAVLAAAVAEQIVPGADQVETLWNVRSGGVYRLESTAVLATPDWNSLGTTTARTDRISLVATNAAGTGYFRLQSLP